MSRKAKLCHGRRFSEMPSIGQVSSIDARVWFPKQTELLRRGRRCRYQLFLKMHHELFNWNASIPSSAPNLKYTRPIFDHCWHELHPHITVNSHVPSFIQVPPRLSLIDARFIVLPHKLRSFTMHLCTTPWHMTDRMVVNEHFPSLNVSDVILIWMACIIGNGPLESGDNMAGNCLWNLYFYPKQKVPEHAMGAQHLTPECC